MKWSNEIAGKFPLPCVIKINQLVKDGGYVRLRNTDLKSFSKKSYV